MAAGSQSSAATSADEMDRMYRYQRYIYDATRKFYLLGRDRLIEGLAAPARGTILEIACGTGRNLVQAAHRYPSTKLYGLDVAQVMLDTAGKTIAREKLAGRVRLAQGDATAFDPLPLFGIRHFDRIFISYALSMIPDWRAAVTAALRRLAPGGSLHIVDFGQLEKLPTAARAGLFAWLKRFDVTPRADLEPALKEVAAEAGATVRFGRLRRGYAYYAVLGRGIAA